MKKKDTIPGKYSYLFDEVIKTPKSRDITRRAIPILVRWIKQGIRHNEYNHLTRELGYLKGYSGIGDQLDDVARVLDRLGQLTGEKIPHPNALVNSKRTGIPSDGLSVVDRSYKDSLNKSEKKEVAHDLQTEAIEYPHWDWVLSVLGLKPSVIDTSSQEKEIRKGKGSGGGEGEEHKALKKYVYDHPEQFGIKKVVYKEMEHILLSGDKLDVYFELKDGSKVAVEVKPSTSPDDDILRGLFQCLKYKSILDAEDRLHGQDASNRVFIVMGGSLSAENNKVRHLFGIEVKENIINKEKKIYYSVPDKPLCWSLANHPGKLTREDVVQNLIAAIEKSNDNGEDWIADIKLSWLQPPEMINSTPQETLENKETIRTWAESLTDIWDIDGAKAEALLNEAGVGEELQKLNQEHLDELEEESDEWTIIRLLDYLPYESPYC